MYPTMRMRTGAKAPSSSPISPKNAALFQKARPALAWVTGALVVGWYVRKQLRRESGDFDNIFSQKNTPEAEASRKKALLVDVYGDPRNSFLNLLGWTK